MLEIKPWSKKKKKKAAESLRNGLGQAVDRISKTEGWRTVIIKSNKDKGKLVRRSNQEFQYTLIRPNLWFIGMEEESHSKVIENIFKKKIITE